MRTLLVLNAVLLLAASLYGQYDSVLLPITPGAQAGAYGSQWLTTVAITNRADTSITVGGFKQGCGSVICVDLPTIQPHATVITSSVFQCSAPGIFLVVEQGRLADVGVTLRTRDMSRQNETWGTSIPAVPATAFYDRTFQALDIPVDQQFRALLRIYNRDSSGVGAATIRIYATNPDGADGRVPDILLHEVTASLGASSIGGCPGYAELPLVQVPGAAVGQRLRADVEPLDDRKYWGFVSVTHDSTQFVTVVTPVQ